MSDRVIEQLSALADDIYSRFLWTADDRLYNSPDHWVSLAEDILNPAKPILIGDCEDVGTGSCEVVWRKEILPATKIRFHLVCSSQGMIENKPFDHFIAGFQAGDVELFLDNAARRKLWQQGRGPWYQFHSYSFYDNPQQWYKS